MGTKVGGRPAPHIRARRQNSPQSPLSERMNKLLIFVLLGLLFAAPDEVLNQILARHNVQA
jgi:hypothetical protein